MKIDLSIKVNSVKDLGEILTELEVIQEKHGLLLDIHIMLDVNKTNYVPLTLIREQV